MRKRIDQKQVAEILKFIEDKDAFVIDLISAINESISKDDPDIIKHCLDEWEASAELNSIPGFSAKVRKRFNSLVKAGIIDE